MKICYHVFWSILLILFGFIFTKGNLQATQLDPITVSGSGLQQRLSKTFSNISVFDREDIEQSGVKSLADLLQNRSSVQVGRNGGLGGVTSFFLRGSESRNVLVLLNGVRLRDELTQSSLAENIPLDLVERIEVIPGNLSSVYGEGAIGGVISIRTTKAGYSVDRRANKLIRLETGSFGTKNISFNIDTSVDDSLTALISGNLLQTNGFSATNPNQTFSSDSTDSDNDKHKNETINLSFSKRLKDGLANFTYFKTDSETFFDNSFFGNNPKQNTDQEQINFVYNFDLANDNNAQISIDSSKINLRYNYGQFFVTKEDKVAFQNDIQLDDNSNLLLGVEKRSVSRNPSSSGIKSRDFESVFLAYVSQRGPVALQANLRNDNTNRFKSRVTYLMGVGYSITPEHSFNANHSTGFVSPNAYALSTNSEVLPEEHDQFEAGYTFLKDSLMFRLFYFDTKTTNAITYDPSDGYKAKNFSRLNNSGFEVSLKNIADKKIFSVSLTFQNPQSPDGLNPSALIQSARRANFFGSVGFSLKKDRYAFSIRGTGSAARKDSEYIQSLEKDLIDDSDDVNKWVLLARSYMKKQNFKKASDAYEEALKILPGQTDLMTELADSLAMIDDGNLNGRPMNLIKRVLEIEPTHQKALALAATNAMNNTEIGNAISYWTRLKDTLPENSDDVEKVLKIIRALKGENPPRSDFSSTNNLAKKALEGKLSIDKDLFSLIQKSLTASSAIFLIVKERNGVAMPIAVKKILYDEFKEPFIKSKVINFKISDVHSMRTEVKLSDFGEVMVSARLSLSGEVKPQAEDLTTNVSLVKSDNKFVKLQFLQNTDN